MDELGLMKPRTAQVEPLLSSPLNVDHCTLALAVKWRAIILPSRAQINAVQPRFLSRASRGWKMEVAGGEGHTTCWSTRRTSKSVGMDSNLLQVVLREDSSG